MLLTCTVHAVICEALWSIGTCSTCVCSSKNIFFSRRTETKHVFAPNSLPAPSLHCNVHRTFLCLHKNSFPYNMGLLVFNYTVNKLFFPSAIWELEFLHK